MDNNDILIRLRYALNLPHPKLRELFASVGEAPDEAELEGIFIREGEPGYAHCSNTRLRDFLAALVLDRRGPPPEGAAPKPAPAGRLTNNEILKQLRIALSLRDEDIVAILALAGAKVSKSELNALFRAPGHENYRACGDQFLRNFLVGLTAKLRGGSVPG